MELRKKVKWLNKYDNAFYSWGVVTVNGKDAIGKIDSTSAEVVSPERIVFDFLGILKRLVESGRADELCPEIFDVLQSFIKW